MKKNTWNNSCDINDKYNYSFFELYIIAIDKAVNIIQNVDNMLKQKQIYNIEIKNLFCNLHYGTGKDCDKDYYYKYFKF